MFEDSETPRLFGCPPGVDFPRAVLRGFEERLARAAPTDWARITLLVNTRRMARRIQVLCEQGPPRLLPRIRLITDLDTLLPGAPPPPAGSGLRRRLELVTLVSKLIEAQPDLAPRAASFDLANSLATLMDEMQNEGVSASEIAALDVSDQSGHWARAQQFIAITQRYMDDAAIADDPEARQRAIVLLLSDHWRENPPDDPILVAGSTGSRGTTAMLMQAVAQLPRGAVILPGFDTDLPDEIWDRMMRSDQPSNVPEEDHPQYRFAKLAHSLGVTPASVRPWTDDAPPSRARNRLVSLALRPAPVTDAWRIEGPGLGDLQIATQQLTVVEADSPRAESLAIAMRLREAAERGETAALITPDRMLTRQVTAALDRWNILPDDSAGTPLQLSPPGRFLRHVAELFAQPLEAGGLLTLLKHPLTHSGGKRNKHQLNTQRLELQIRRDGMPYPDADSVRHAATKALPDEDLKWAEWVAEHLCGQHVESVLSVGDWVDRHIACAIAIAEGSDPEGESELWQKEAGQVARAAMEDLRTQAEHGGPMTAADYAALVSAVLAQGEVRDRDAPHPNIMIWGTLEARVQGAELVILGGLNDGTWPEPPAPDPWLNRRMRLDAGLLLPERRIGLSAHDFQQAIAAPEVFLTRAIRSDDAETVPSRWLNRLSNLIRGLPDQGGKDAWAKMTERGQHWLNLARDLERVDPVPKAQRPAPCPPVAARPRKLSVTEIQTLIRDPYAIYAKHSLRLRPLNPLVQTPDALLRGILAHKVMEHFVRAVREDQNMLTPDQLLRIASEVLAEQVPWPAARTLWNARFQRTADWIVDTERNRLLRATPAALEAEAIGSIQIRSAGVTLHVRADRIDIDPEGKALIYDYKTGTPPTKDQQAHFDKQLLIEAAMVEEGGFDSVGPRTVHSAQYIGLGTSPKIVDAPLEDEPPHKVMAELASLLTVYLDTEQGYTSRRALHEDRQVRDCDQLARFGEWDATDEPVRTELS